MIELLIKACVLPAHLSSPEPECRDFSLLFDPHEVSLVTCMTQAQPIIARWNASNPQWEVKRWQCDMQARNVSRI